MSGRSLRQLRQVGGIEHAARLSETEMLLCNVTFQTVYSWFIVANFARVNLSYPSAGAVGDSKICVTNERSKIWQPTIDIDCIKICNRRTEKKICFRWTCETNKNGRLYFIMGGGLLSCSDRERERNRPTSNQIVQKSIPCPHVPNAVQSQRYTFSSILFVTNCKLCRFLVSKRRAYISMLIRVGACLCTVTKIQRQFNLFSSFSPSRRKVTNIMVTME